MLLTAVLELGNVDIENLDTEAKLHAIRKDDCYYNLTA